jgi:hypothetical protein
MCDVMSCELVGKGIISVHDIVSCELVKMSV